MIARLSLKYRIAVIIFALEAVMMGVVLWQTLSYSLESSTRLLAANEQLIHDLMAEVGYLGLVTEEYNDLQDNLERFPLPESVVHMVVTDESGIAVAATDTALLGEDFSTPPRAGDGHWRVKTIADQGGTYGAIAIQFSNEALAASSTAARRLGIGLAFAGMIIIASIGVLAGHLLTRRLTRLERVTREFASGVTEARAQLGGRDEVARLGRAFDDMAAKVARELAERRQAEATLRQSSEALRDSEALFHAFIDNSPSEIFLRDAEGHFIVVNRAWETSQGLSTGKAKGQRLHDIFPADRADMYAAQDQSVLEAGTALDQEIGVDFAEGKKFLHIIKFPLIDAEGRINGVGGITTDITDRKLAEEALRQAQKMEAVGQLTGGVAHDFNNLLAIILGNLELVENNLPGDDNNRNQIEKAIEATERGAQLTQRLLAFSRKQALRPVPVDARKLIHDMQDLLRRSLGETIEIEIVAEAGLWATEIDPGQLEGALLNLAINARDAMPDGGKLTIEASNARLTDEYAAAQIDVEPGQYVLVSISDTGTGMTPEVCEKIFEPFFTTKEAGKGTGLGLSMVHGFVKQSGGHIAIYSEVGEGTTFKLYLPRYKGDMAAAEQGGKAGESVSGVGEVILVVEDDTDLRTMIINMLQSLGYRVLESGTAKGALEVLAETADVNLLLTDVVLPGGMSGRELSDRVRENYPDRPVLYMSGYTENAIIHQGRLDEGVQLLEKPFRQADLARAIRKALDREPS